jgi:pimeloyl-[acyl-carrier protein] methyl ester esterase
MEPEDCNPACLYMERCAQDSLPLVCLHGWGMNLRVFDGLRAGLATQQCVWSIDLAGHGKSPWRADRASFAAQAQDIAALLPERCVMMGWSLGGQLAMQIARDLQERVSALVLVTTTPRFERSADWPHGLDADSVAVFRNMLGQDWRQTLSDFVWLQLRGSRNAVETQRTLEEALHSHGTPNPAALLAGLEILATLDQRSQVNQIWQPCLVISGQNDRVTPSAAAIWLADHLPNARHIEIARAGHAPFISHSEEFLQPVRAFLEAQQAHTA